MNPVVKLLVSSIECVEPQTTIVDVLRKHDGKRFDKAVVDEINELVEDGIKVDRSNGTVDIVWRNGGRLTVSMDPTAPVVDIDWIELANRDILLDLYERNSRRRSALTNDDFINDIYATIEMFKHNAKKLRVLTEFIGVDVNKIMEYATEGTQFTA